nr:zinc ribbon domain-containing protein [uncultured Draconibacterium sp.]
MPFCTQCGNELSVGARFCGKCGKDQLAGQNQCANCGNELEENEKFCSGCGTPVVEKAERKTAPKKQRTAQSKEEKFTKEGRKIISGGPKSVQNKQAIPPPTSVNTKQKKKKKGCRGCAITSIIILAVLIVLTMLVYGKISDWWQEYYADQDIELNTEGVDGIVDIEEGDVSHLPENRTKASEKNADFGIDIPITTKWKSIKKESLKVSENNTVANFEKVKVDFGQFILDQETSVNVEEYEPQIIDDECSVVAYDIDLKGKSEFDDYLTVTLPYNESFIENGKAEDCVAAQYYNPKTKRWEPVLYELDTKNKQVHIYTDHLSRYGVFTVKNDLKRRAYISGFYIPDSYFSSDKKDLHLDILEKYYSGGRSLGEEALSKGLSFWGKFSGHSGATINTLTLGGKYSTDFIDGLNDKFKNAGYVASTVQLAYDLWRGDQKNAAINLTKNLMNQMVAEVNIASLNLAFVGVYFIDYSLTQFGNAAMASRYKELFDVYDFYNKNYNSHRRSLKEWRAFFIETEKEYQKNPQEASNLIMEEIDAYSREFIDKIGLGTDHENTVEFNALAGEAGKKSVAWPNKADVVKIQQEGKQQLIDKLYPVFTSLNNYRIRKMKEELIKELKEIQKEVNTVVPITIMEDLDPGEKPDYANHFVCIRPLDEEADIKQWTGKLNDRGAIKTSCTILGFILAGEPYRVEVYDPEDVPDDDEPVFEKEFEMNPKGITIYLGSDEPEIVVGSVVLTNNHKYEKARTSIYGINDPLEVIAGIKDFDIQVDKEGRFSKTIKGQIFESIYERQSSAIYDGYIFKAGNIILNGEIDVLRLIEKMESGTNTVGEDGSSFKIGTMKYTSNGSFTEKEIVNASSWGAEDYAKIIQGYSFSTQATYDLFLGRNTRIMDAPYIIYAETENGKCSVQNEPSAQNKQKNSNIPFANSIEFNITIR